MRQPFGLAAVCISALLSLGTVGPPPESDGEKHTTVKTDSVRRQGGGRRALSGDPFFAISTDRLFATLGDLTSINPHNGWRHSTTRGEAQAIAYVRDRLSKLDFLRDLGLEIEQEDFRTYLGIEFRQTRVHLTVEGTEYEVPADAPAGHRDLIDLAMRFDSDGELNDNLADPVVAEGSALVIRSAAQVFALSPEEVEGRIVFLDYAVIDRVINDRADAIDVAWTLAALQPAGIVMVTEYSNRRGLSHGSFVSDLPAFTWVEVDPLPPVLFVRLEDLDPAGVETWADLSGVESVRLTWDVDLFSPGESSLLMARIPGADSSQAVILSAHIDSSNTPGAFDNGSGSTALLEVARALDRSRTIPPVDLHLVWFGSHERGIYGSANFVTTHSELIDRGLGLLQMDCLGRPVDDIEDFVTLEAWTYGRFGDDRMTWPDYLEAAASDRGIETLPISYYGLVSDNTNFNAVDLPNANLIYMNAYDIFEIHYDNHLHDPYDTVELAEEVGDPFEEMAKVMLTAALQTGEDSPRLRVTPEPDRRALFVGSHTEAVHMSTPSFIEFGMALAWEGFDVDTIPYGRPVGPADLEDADLVIVLPVHDYPSTDGDVTLYDEAWSEAEVDALEDYVADGGMVVLTNSARRLKYLNYAYETNEDWADANAVGDLWGVNFDTASVIGTTAIAVAGHPLIAGVTTLRLADNNAVPFTADGGVELARMAGRSVATLIDAGAGEVLVLADLGLLGSSPGEPQNLRFWQNIAEYARDR